MISNSRSTARRNYRSDRYSSKVLLAHHSRTAPADSSTSNSSFRVWLFINELTGVFDFLAKVWIANALFGNQFDAAVEEFFKAVDQAEIAVGIGAGGLAIRHIDHEIKVAVPGIEAIR